jgi:DNA repair exonuclease SbcCD ATPase subunit
MEVSLGKRIRSIDRIIFGVGEATNVLSFEHVKFDFRKRGVVCIVGKNKSGGILASNGAGKTNFLSLPCVALQGKTFKGQQHDKWANWRTKGPAVSSQELRTTRGKISIIRGRRPATLQLLINGKDASAGKTQLDVQKQIEEVTGFTYDTLANSVYIDQTLSNAFILGTDKSRAELIARFQNLDKYELARKLAAVDMKKLVTSESETEYEIGVLSSHLKDRKDELKAQNKAILVEKSTVKEELKEAKEMQAIEERRASAKTKILGAQKSALEKKYSYLFDEDHKISSEIYMLKHSVSQQEKVLGISHLDNCPTCLRPITKGAQRHMSSEAKKAHDIRRKKISKMLKRQKTLKRKLSRYESKVMSLGKKIDMAEEFVAGGKRWISELKGKLRTIEDIRKQTKKASGASAAILDSKRKIEASKEYLKDVRHQKNVVTFAIDTFSRKGFPAFLSKLVCPVLNKASEYYSDLFLDGEISVVFEVENDTLTPKIINPNGDKEIQGQSTGEKAWAGLIASFALREIAQRSNLLILDEPGHGLDPSGAKRFGERIKKLEKRFDTILITTHNENIRQALEGASQLEVVKSNKISKISKVV